MKKTFCIFSAHYLPHVGGVEKYTQHLARALSEQGNRVIIVTSNVHDLPNTELLEQEIEIVRLPCYKLLNGRYPITRHNSTYRKLANYLLEQNIDYVTINTRFYRHSLEGVKLAELKGIRPIIVDHGSAHLTMGNKIVDPFVAMVEHAVTELVKRHSADYYAVSQAGIEWLRHFGIEACGVLNNSIDALAFAKSASHRSFRREANLSNNAFAVAFTGRLIPEKGIPALAEAARMLVGEPLIHFFVAGEGPLKETLTKEPLSNVTFLGRLEARDISALLKESDIFCLPSRSEGFSTSLLEAAACKAAPLVTNVGGVQELVPSDAFGVILPSADGKTIADAIRDLNRNRARCRAMGESINKLVIDKFSWNETARLTTLACSAAQERNTEALHETFQRIT
ncbi:MAG: D-inositol-3-phosphate glycosyltransferase [Paraeggerthella hongkongensis]